MEVKKVFINLDSSTQRRNKFVQSFVPNRFERFSAIDGKQFSSSVYDKFGRYLWDETKRKALIDTGFLHRESKIFPVEYAATLSHIKVWKNFLSDGRYNLLWCCEDDVTPIGDLKNELLENVVEDIDCDILYLFSPHHPGRRVFLFKDGNVRFCRSHMSYLMTRKGVERAAESMRTVFFQSDLQVSLCLGDRIQKRFIKKLPKKLQSFERISIKGSHNGLIEQSILAKRTTFTKFGRKLYLHNDFRI